ncbi:MAG: hypothetical protein U0Q18_03665 [Bryobacteraceae bacterium]
MAARAPIVPAVSAGMDLWDRFLSLAEQYVQEGNFLAGECLWEIGKLPGTLSAMVIRSTMDPAGSVECSFDPETGVLTCAPGSGARVNPVSFQLLRTAADETRTEGGTCTLEHAIAFILDELVWIEDGCAQLDRRLKTDPESTTANLDQAGASRIPA